MGLAVLRRSLIAGFILGVAICFANAPRETAGASLAAIRLVPDVASPQPVGTTITWSVSNSSPDIWNYRLRLGLEDEPLRVMYDFSPRLTFPWTPIENGRYTVLLTAHNPVTGAVTNVQETFDITSRVRWRPIVSRTGHPLVALYSAPECRADSMRVVSQRLGSQMSYATSSKPCRQGRSMNFYVAGMRAESTYVVRHEILDGSGNVVSRGPRLAHTTARLDSEVVFPEFSVTDPPDAQTAVGEPVLLQAPLMGQGRLAFPVATDLAGDVIWYYTPPQFHSVGIYLTRPVPGGTMLMIIPDGPVFGQRLWEIDVAGNIVRETTVAGINQQLDALGEDRIGGFHHEALRFPNGQTLVLAGVERILTDVQGQGPVDVLGDMIIALDENWQVVWTWNSFDHLDATRLATLGETCNEVIFFCNVPLQLALQANDWTHSNTLAYSPSDRNLLVSVRNQDWVLKLDYRDGVGSGDILWRLGREGDFTMLSGDPNPWFTHQHDVGLLDTGQIMLYDNGTLRCEKSPNPEQDCYSRGQVLNVSESTRVVTLALNAHLGTYAQALGSAERLRNGNYHFTSGVMFDSRGVYATSDEVLPSSGRTTYSQLTRFVSLYRSFRMRDLYTP